MSEFLASPLYDSLMTIFSYSTNRTEARPNCSMNSAHLSAHSGWNEFVENLIALCLWHGTGEFHAADLVARSLIHKQLDARPYRESGFFDLGETRGREKKADHEAHDDSSYPQNVQGRNRNTLHTVTIRAWVTMLAWTLREFLHASPRNNPRTAATMAQRQLGKMR